MEDRPAAPPPMRRFGNIQRREPLRPPALRRGDDQRTSPVIPPPIDYGTAANIISGYIPTPSELMFFNASLRDPSRFHPTGDSPPPPETGPTGS